MRSDLPYDAIPNFTAADALRTVGVGRNEYISIMNAAKAKKLLWRVNKGIVKELLPHTPISVGPDGWWTVNIVNIGESEWRSLNPAEASTCRRAAKEGGVPYEMLDPALVEHLYRQGLVWFDVPISQDDLLSIPPLEGFVSNRTSVKNIEADPMESLMYQIFVAASDRVTVSQLAEILSVDIEQLLIAVSVGCRLQFCRKLVPNQFPNDDRPKSGSKNAVADHGLVFQSPDSNSSSPFNEPGGNFYKGRTPTAQDIETIIGRDSKASQHDASPSVSTSNMVQETPIASECSPARSIALVVDSELTGMLMMGALSADVKKHSVTLFEGGRVYGSGVMRELVHGLKESAELSTEFEGEMAMLSDIVTSLAYILDTVNEESGGRGIELLRKESLEYLDRSAAERMILHSYSVLVPIARLSGPPLPLPLDIHGSLLSFGPSIATNSPWSVVMLWTTCGGPSGMVMPAGKRLQALPDMLCTCSQLLIWPWDPTVCRMCPLEPFMIPRSTALVILNRLLSRTPLLVQPLDHFDAEKDLVEVPLPLTGSEETTEDDMSNKDILRRDDHSFSPHDAVLWRSNSDNNNEATRRDSGSAIKLEGFYRNGSCVSLQLPKHTYACLQGLGFESTIGSLTVLRKKNQWTVLSFVQGMPTLPKELCKAVCETVQKSMLLTSDVQAKHISNCKKLTNAVQAVAQQWASDRWQSCAADGTLFPKALLWIDASEKPSIFPL